MLKLQHILTCWLMLIGLVAFAQTDTLYYFTKTGLDKKIKNSADYYRVVTPSIRDSHKFIEYHKDGSTLTGSVFEGSEKKEYSGLVISFYNSGKTNAVLEYNDGVLNKTINYHPNGTLLKIINKNIPHQPYEQLMYEADSTVKVNVIDGKGKHTEKGVSKDLFNSDDFTEHYIMSGQLLNGVKDGMWVGTNDLGTNFSEKYAEGKRISGKSISATGKKYSYKYILCYPVYDYSRKAFEAWIKNHLTTLADTLHLKFDGRHHLLLNYTINKDGKPINIKGFEAATFKETDIALSSIPRKWSPATIRGVPVVYNIIYSQFTPDSNGPQKFVVIHNNVQIKSQAINTDINKQ